MTLLGLMAVLASPTEQMTVTTSADKDQSFSTWLFRLLVGVALGYSLLAGLRTLTDYDLFWQMATGRWVAQHHTVPSVDVFSYTASGQPWIYPVGSGIVFYATFLLGGYALLSWLGALACVATAALSFRRGTALTAAIAILAVPCIAARTTPRADMFTVVLFAAFLSIIWQQLETGRARLWILPPLMVAWVNLHLGFVAALALLTAYVGLELFSVFGSGRAYSIARLRRAWPWLAGTVAATLLNPWGWNLYGALYRQQSAMRLHSQWITEWRPASLNLQSLSLIFDLRNPESSFYLLLVVALVAAGLALWQRRIGAALLIAAAAYEGIRHVRMQALFACVVVIVGGAVLSSSLSHLKTFVQDHHMRAILAGGTAAFVVLLALVRSVDLVSNWQYFGATETANFGAGLSWVFPERATRFIRRESLPPEIFNIYSQGGFAIWALAPEYRDFIDGRAIPFGPGGFDRHESLLHAAPSSAAWDEGPQQKVNVILAPLARYDGIQFFPYLAEFCSSQVWAPVYMDEVSAVFVRRRAVPESLIHKLQIDCFSARLPVISNNAGRTETFNAWANAASTLTSLGRSREALHAANQALAIFPNSAMIRFIRGNLLAGMGYLPQAEADYLVSTQSEPTDVTWMALADLYRRQGKLGPAIGALEQAVGVSTTRYNPLLQLAAAYMEAHRPADALRALDQAERNAPPAAQSRDLYLASVAEGRSAAWNSLGNPGKAISYMEKSVQLAPNDSTAWMDLANLYAAYDRPADAAQARRRAAALAPSAPQ